MKPSPWFFKSDSRYYNDGIKCSVRKCQERMSHVLHVPRKRSYCRRWHPVMMTRYACAAHTAKWWERNPKAELKDFGETWLARFSL